MKGRDEEVPKTESDTASRFLSVGSLKCQFNDLTTGACLMRTVWIFVIWRENRCRCAVWYAQPRTSIIA
ncbi:hypothetical protein N7517_006174 [Penicillium concentricum]|uniref:Uncharacterized protein n=1 Tax=Penicillium concentricum TaxID=293559 RepID=A0A9W9V9R7_9EURO|nr:uncharacterized protein N7517_006174 [Penicillium concentricum]KAJ5374168.1 hypothetical protein N7517_006174 [Penicillium concentricum]